MPRIRGTIIRIIDKETIIIDLGRNHGVRKGSIFSIIGDPELIEHPLTGETLGEVQVVKARLKATQVHNRFTIAVSKWQELDNSITAGGLLYSALTAVGDSLNVHQSDIEPWKAISSKPVHKGDIVEVSVSDPKPKPESKPEKESDTE